MSPRERLLDAWARWVTRHPAATLLMSLLVAAVSILLAATSLELHSDRSDLVSGDLDWNQRYATYRHDFPRWDDLVLCIEGDPGDHRIDELARQVAERLNAEDRIASADAGFTAAQAPRMWKVADAEKFNQALTWFEHAKKLAVQSGPAEALFLFSTSLPGFEHQSSMLEGIETFLRPMLEGLNGRSVTFDLTAPIQNTWQPLTIGSGSIRTVLIQMDRASTGGIETVGEDLELVRTTATELIEHEMPGVSWGVTGLPALEADETTQAIDDSTWASIIAFVLVTLMMLLVFKRLTLPLLAAVSLLVGMAWSFGWVVLAVGHLQLLSVVFSAILIGLGIDFALHLLARLRIVHAEYDTLPDAMARSFRDVGPGLITGAVTTASAFACTALTDFKGVAEMGIIAGGGVLLLLVAMLCVFPALLALCSNWREQINRVRPWDDRIVPSMLGWVPRHAAAVLVATVLLVAALFIPLSRVGYDSNILNLQPPDLESVAWQHRLEQEAGVNIWSGLVLTTPTQAPALVAQLRSLPGIGGVGGMGMLFPTDMEDREQQIMDIRSDVPASTVLSGSSPQDILVSTLQAIAGGLESRASGVPAAVALAGDISDSIEAWNTADPGERDARFERIEEAWTLGSAALDAAIEDAMTPGMPGPSQLPAVLHDSWIGVDGQWLLRVEPLPEERSILEPERLEGFVEEIRRVAPDVLGPPVQILESSRLITHSYQSAAIYAFLAVMLILLVDFRSLLNAGLAMLPVLIGFVGVFGVMGVLGMKVNFANLMVLPLIFGIGVDAGVHAVHRWKREPGVLPPGLGGGTGQAITLTMLTTMIGFGSLLVAEHRGIRSLSIVMVTGLGITWLACMIVLPAALHVRQRFSRKVKS